MPSSECGYGKSVAISAGIDRGVVVQRDGHNADPRGAEMRSKHHETRGVDR